MQKIVKSYSLVYLPFSHKEGKSDVWHFEHLFYAMLQSSWTYFPFCCNCFTYKVASLFVIFLCVDIASIIWGVKLNGWRNVRYCMEVYARSKGLFCSNHNTADFNETVKRRDSAQNFTDTILWSRVTCAPSHWRSDISLISGDINK